MDDGENVSDDEGADDDDSVDDGENFGDDEGVDDDDSVDDDGELEVKTGSVTRGGSVGSKPQLVRPR